MGNRLTKIYTRTGDDGTTGTAGGARVAKDDLQVQVIGDIDELNCQLAVVACHVCAEYRDAIKDIQNELFNVGAELSMGHVLIKQKHVEQLERSVDGLNQNLTPLQEFILPGGGPGASHCHVARAVCRRAERSLVSLNRQKTLNICLLSYVNRLSDYLFVLARAISRQQGIDEVYWQSARMKNE